MSVRQLDWLFVALSFAAWFAGLVYYCVFAFEPFHLTVFRFLLIWIFGALVVGGLNFALTAIAGAVTLTLTGDVEGHRMPLVVVGVLGLVLDLVLSRQALLLFG